MQLDLRLLSAMHPLLPQTLSDCYAHHAAVALQRRGHEPGTSISIKGSSNGSDDETVVLEWERVPATDRMQLDRNRVTEDAAEAVALAWVSVSNRWAILRRLQRGEHADWLLSDMDGDRVALEISGIDGYPDPRREREKLEQVRKFTFASVHSTCVVAMVPPAVAHEVI